MTICWVVLVTFEHDRAFAEKAMEIMPELERAARRNRAFLGRAVRFCMSRGVRQFLDIGSGIPTVGNVHEIAQGIDPQCRVLYVDNEPVAVADAGGQREHGRFAGGSV